ncbi:MAG: hypothetical protein E7459_07030 [Ruminococcaceae bacterium]|nr:hypothetical protein [Oscillospiraceae bacterium]
MKITVSGQPSILHEAVELVHAFVNQLPTEQLTVPGPCSIPPEEIVRIRDLACSGLNPADEELQFFFHGHPFEDNRDGQFSLARNMVYAWAQEVCSDADEMANFLLHYWKTHRGTLRVRSVHTYGLYMVPDEQGRFQDLTGEISKLPLSCILQMQLIETISSYELYLPRLMSLIRPVIARLKTLLSPWIQQCTPLLQRWVQFFSEEENFRKFFLERSAVDSELPAEMRLCPRCFWPHVAYVFPSESYQLLNVHLAAGREPGFQEPREEEIALENRDYLILRQLSSADRMSMLIAMMDCPMTAMEVSRKLDLHPSSVFRDISAMGNSHLLVQEIKSGKSTYRTNYTLLEKLFRKILCRLENTRNTPGR